MANDEDWDKRTTEWVEMTRRSSLRKTFKHRDCSLLQGGDPELQNEEFDKVRPHDGAIPPRHP